MLCWMWQCCYWFRTFTIFVEFPLTACCILDTFCLLYLGYALVRICIYSKIWDNFLFSYSYLQLWEVKVYDASNVFIFSAISRWQGCMCHFLSLCLYFKVKDMLWLQRCICQMWRLCQIGTDWSCWYIFQRLNFPWIRCCCTCQVSKYVREEIWYDMIWYDIQSNLTYL